MKTIKEKKETFIKCPNCGCEYTLAEVFIPEEYFGRPLEVERDATTGRIRNYFGKGNDFEETYMCDRCDTTFKVCAVPKIKTWIPTKITSEPYVTVYAKNSLFLKEE